MTDRVKTTSKSHHLQVPSRHINCRVKTAALIHFLTQELFYRRLSSSSVVSSIRRDNQREEEEEEDPQKQVKEGY